MIVHCVSKVISGDAVGLQQNVINVVFGDGQLALDHIIELELILNRTLAAEAEDPGLAFGNLCFDIFNCPITPNGILAVVAEVFLVCFLLLAHSGQFFFGAEAGVSLAFFYQLLGKYMVKAGSLPLTIRAVVAKIASMGCAFVKGDAIVLQSVDENLHRTGNFTLGVGVFHAQKQHTAGLVGHTLRD